LNQLKTVVTARSTAMLFWSQKDYCPR